jgi:hypothetical protein
MTPDARRHLGRALFGLVVVAAILVWVVVALTLWQAFPGGGTP